MKHIIAMALLVSVAWGVTAADDGTIRAAEGIVRAERAKVGEHNKALAEARAKLNLSNLTPQERLYLNNVVVSQTRYAQEAQTRVFHAETAVVRLKAAAQVAKAAVAVENPVAPAVPVVAPDATAKKTSPSKIVTFNDGTTLEILRFMEVETDYSLQTLDKKFKTVPKDSVKRIEDKVESKTITD